jgi:addiction module HigA family antidote
MADFAPTHPGEILKTEFLDPLGISQYRIAKTIDVPPRRINDAEIACEHFAKQLATIECIA